MTSLILSTATRFLHPLLLLFSVFILVRGHDEPGGGFVGGLLAASAFALYAIAETPEAARTALRVEPRVLIASGLLIATGSGLLAIFVRRPFLTGLWMEVPGTELSVGTPTCFDVGVYLVVLGSVLTMVLSLAEQE